MNTRILSTLAALALLITPACMTTEKAAQICPQAQSLSEELTLRILASNNNDQTKNTLRSVELSFRTASENDTLTFDQLADLISALPFKDIQNPDVRLGVRLGAFGLTLLFPETQIDISKAESPRIIAGCLANGITTALNP